jgi:hypothetical protein
VAAAHLNPFRQLALLPEARFPQSSSLPHSDEQSAGALPTCRQMPPAHSSAGLDIVTPSPSDVGTPRSQGAPTAAGDGGQPAPAKSRNNEATNGIAAEQNVRARMVGLCRAGTAMRTPATTASFQRLTLLARNPVGAGGNLDCSHRGSAARYHLHG